MSIVYTLLFFIALYVAVALLSFHEKVRSSVEPKNIALNIWNFLVIGLTVVVSLLVFKVVFAKLAALGVPGAAHIAALVDAA